ncbi:GTPase IMAP family member 4-like [Lepisosteus oculatus]|uniref:GTPase IMAP family member 4-like n=1 Tax=Lepisosteus oculatus TaxID=7918 RepID=UPI0035F520B0
MAGIQGEVFLREKSHLEDEKSLGAQEEELKIRADSRERELGHEEGMRERKGEIRTALEGEEMTREAETDLLPKKRRSSFHDDRPNVTGGAVPETSPGLSSSPDIPEPSSKSDLRLVLLGQTGAWKSAAGNTVLGAELFPSEASSSAVTRHSEKRKGRVARRRVAVVDKPDWIHTELSQEEVKKDVGLCINLSSPGPHAFLLVIPVGRSSGVEKSLLEMVQEIFGEGAVEHTLVLFTHMDELKGKTIEEFLQEGSTDLKWLVERCGNRYHVLNNNNMDDRSCHGCRKGQTVEWQESGKRPM